MSEPKVHRAGSWDDGITPAKAGWTYVSTAVHRLSAGESLSVRKPGEELAIVPLSGVIEVTSGGDSWTLGGRASVFDGLGWCLYLPTDASADIRADGDVEFVVSSAPATEVHPAKLVTPDDVSIDVRGGGNASRQIGNLIAPDFEADRLLVIEVWTPGGNWSSFPPHKHEVDREGESELEESYYYRFRNPQSGWGIQRVYNPDRGFDLVETVRDGDITTMPWGYHTTVAAHGQDLYYLNVLAGPAKPRTLQAFIDPTLESTRDAWADAQADERLPLVPRWPV